MKNAILILVALAAIAIAQTISGGGSGGSGGSGALALLEQHTANASAELDFTNWYNATFDDYLIEFAGLLPATNGVNCLLEMSTNLGVSYDTGANYFGRTLNPYSGGAGISGVQSVNALLLIDTWSNNVNYPVTGSYKISGPGNASAYKMILGDSIYYNNGVSTIVRAEFLGVYSNLSAVNAFRVRASSGNIASGTVRVYGMAKT